MAALAFSRTPVSMGIVSSTSLSALAYGFVQMGRATCPSHRLLTTPTTTHAMVNARKTMRMVTLTPSVQLAASPTLHARSGVWGPCVDALVLLGGPGSAGDDAACLSLVLVVAAIVAGVAMVVVVIAGVVALPPSVGSAPLPDVFVWGPVDALGGYGSAGDDAACGSSVVVVVVVVVAMPVVVMYVVAVAVVLLVLASSVARVKVVVALEGSGLPRPCWQ